MEPILRGKVWLFGANVSTDEILPGRYLDRSSEEVGAFAMSGIDEDFAHKITRGDLLVAGTNFGCGSSRETAPIALKSAGIAAVIAESFARIFYRNAVNIGLLALVVPSTKKIQQGDVLEIEVERQEVRDLTTGETQSIQNLFGVSWEILQQGGIINYTIHRMHQNENHSNPIGGGVHVKR